MNTAKQLREEDWIDELFDNFERDYQQSSGSMAFQKSAIQAKQFIAQKINEAERMAYGRGTIDTLDHVKQWADEIDESYNQMMSDRLKAIEPRGETHGR